MLRKLSFTLPTKRTPLADLNFSKLIPISIIYLEDMFIPLLNPARLKWSYHSQNPIICMKSTDHAYLDLSKPK